MASSKDIAEALEGIIGKNDEETTVKAFLDTGFPPLNFALSAKWDGGMPVGRVVEMFGPASSGKTAISTCVMAAAQKMGGVAGFSDHERSFSQELAQKRLGLDITPGRFIFKKPKTFEQSLDICVQAAKTIREKKLILPNAPIVWVFDSLASMVPQSKMQDKNGGERGLDSYTMHDNLALAKATSSAFPAFVNYCEQYDMLALFLNQVRTKPNVMYGDATTTPGGDAPKFYASVRISLSASKIHEDKTDAKAVLGQEITARVIKNKISRPFLKAKWRFLFENDGTGKFDVVHSLLEFLVEEEIIKKEGKRIVWKDGKSYFLKTLAEKIEQEGKVAELIAMLPKAYTPEVEEVSTEI